MDEDTHSFNQIMNAFKLPKDSKHEKEIRRQAIEDATKYAIEVPMQIMKNAFASMEVMDKMVDQGMPSSLSDAAVGALCARTAVMGAYLNVKINAIDLHDADFKSKMLTQGAEIEEQAIAFEKLILKKVNEKL